MTSSVAQRELSAASAGVLVKASYYTNTLQIFSDIVFSVVSKSNLNFLRLLVEYLAAKPELLLLFHLQNDCIYFANQEFGRANWLGEGHFGMVTTYQSTTSADTVVVKTPKYSSLDSDQSIKEWIDEEAVWNMVYLEQPGYLFVNDKLTSVYFVMPDFGNVDLRHALDNASSVEAQLDILFSLVNEVENIYKKNIAHDDLKFKNILVMNETNVKIVDFGISRIGNKFNSRDMNFLTATLIPFLRHYYSEYINADLKYFDYVNANLQYLENEEKFALYRALILWVKASCESSNEKKQKWLEQIIKIPQLKDILIAKKLVAEVDKQLKELVSASALLKAGAAGALVVSSPAQAKPQDAEGSPRPAVEVKNNK